jgi:folate-binding protein YgfZ
MSTWQDFLQTQRSASTQLNAFCSPSPTANALSNLEQFALLSISGAEAANFLQGQIPYNVNELSATQSCFTALCDAKGKVLASFLLVKSTDGFLLVLPKELIAIVKTRLQRYVLRAKVLITDESERLTVLGWSSPASDLALFATHQHTTHQAIHFINRELIITSHDNALHLCQEKLAQGFQMQTMDSWHYSDMLAGIAWLNGLSSEQFTVQMLNIDKIGGVSFNKGCYTGQEIVARTHYLGKVNRSLLTAEVITTTAIESGAVIIDDTGQSVGKVISIQKNAINQYVLLIVLSNAEQNKSLYLTDASEVTLLANQFSYS